jgi:hypothetical protein
VPGYVESPRSPPAPSSQPGTVHRPLRRLALAILVPLASAGAQLRAPTDGALTSSIGQPHVWHWVAGTAVGVEETGERMRVIGELRGSISRDLGNPLVGLGNVQLETYASSGWGVPDAGLRARLMVPFLRTGVGVERNVVDPRTRLLFSILHPLRRGGVFADGSQIRLEFSPGPDFAVRLGLDKPFQRRLPPGRSRPPLDHAPLSSARVTLTRPPQSEVVRSALGEARQRAAWIGRVTVPWLDHRSSDRADSERLVRAQLASLRADLTEAAPGGSRRPRLIEDEVTAFHAAMERAFGGALAAGSATPTLSMVQAVATRARTVLLDEVLFPYDRLLGQSKVDDTTEEFARRARGIFLRWLHTESGVPQAAVDDVLGVFIALLEIVEENRAAIKAQWRDSRFVWLPLQYGLLPAEHDTQSELDALIERATGEGFSDGNIVSYAINEQAQYQFSRMIRAAREYHVLWIHDFRGVDDVGDPDEQSYRQVLRSYYRAMTERVREYDSTGTFPTYVILLDEWFYEWREARLWMTLLEDPLRHRVSLPAAFSSWEDSLRVAQDSLRAAVAASRLLQSQRAEFGDDWLERLIRVQVNITNRADWTFWSRRLSEGALAMSDNILRDHRKISFYDISEEDPYRGEAMLTGAGVGENYSNISWEDRSLLVRGPAALHLKAVARQVLIDQGMPLERLPWQLRERARSPDYDRIVRDSTEGARRMRRAMGLHNATGYGPKDVNVAKAVLYTLLPSGSVIKAPDSLWNASFWGAAMAGCALRGGRVIVIAPSLANSPVWAFGSVEHAYDLLWRLTMVTRELAPELRDRGGLLRVGVFTSQLNVTQVPEKVAAVHRTFAQQPWLRELFAFPPSVYDGLGELVETLSDVLVPSLFKDFEFDPYPKLHLKANLFASREAWSLMSRPEWPNMTYEFVLERIKQVQEREAAVLISEAEIAPMLDVGDGTVHAWSSSLPAATRERVVFYTMIGSHNHNARSMVTDGEAALVVSGWPSIVPVLDLIALIGQSRWVDDPSELAALIPPESGIERWLAHRFRLVF